jgi:hypothetical protein
MVGGEIIAGLGALKTAFDTAKTLKHISDAAIRNAAVVELQEKILTAQQTQAALIEEVSSLEKKVAGFEAWEAEKQRYQLTDFGGGTFAFLLKPASSGGEPSHRICANCYQIRQKAILQFSHIGTGQEYYDCLCCGKRQAFGVRKAADWRSVTGSNDL